MEVTLHRCPEEDCDAAYLHPEALKAHKQVHTEDSPTEEARP